MMKNLRLFTIVDPIIIFLHWNVYSFPIFILKNRGNYSLHSLFFCTKRFNSLTFSWGRMKDVKFFYFKSILLLLKNLKAWQFVRSIMPVSASMRKVGSDNSLISSLSGFNFVRFNLYNIYLLIEFGFIKQLTNLK